MCGIAGIAGSDEGLDKEALLGALQHRGPDRQAGVRPKTAGETPAWLGATRLAISDLSAAGNQPMSTEDGRYTVVFNGEIYNAPLLRKELAQLDQRFIGHSDTEVLLRGFAVWGPELLGRLEGMFAFAVWDSTTDALFIARDRLGIKPLWYHRRGERLVFASEIRALLQAKAVPAAIDPSSLESYLAWGSVAEPRAIIRDVEALPPAHYLTFVKRRLTVARYWSIPDGEIDCSESVAAARIRERLSYSVDQCMHADVPVGLLLSGGIDSTALLSLSKAGRAIRTFHVGVGDVGRGRAAAMAERFGCEHRELSVDPEALQSVVPAFLRALDQPSVDGLNTFVICKAIAAVGLKAAVTGLGADEIFLGYPLHSSYLRMRGLRKWLGPVWPPLGAGAGLLGRWIAGRESAGAWKAEKLLEIAVAQSNRATHASARALFPAATREQLLGMPAGVSSTGYGAGETGTDADVTAVSEVARFEVGTYLVNTLLRDSDIMSMAHGVELRVPMLDHQLVSDVVRMSARLRLRPGRKKPLLVDAAAQLPPEIASDPKTGFELPFEKFLATRHRDDVAEVLHSSAIHRVGLNAGAVDRVWKRFTSSEERASAHRVWALYTLVHWAQANRASI